VLYCDTGFTSLDWNNCLTEVHAQIHFTFVIIITSCNTGKQEYENFPHRKKIVLM
jgi:hypothetical protein